MRNPRPTRRSALATTLLSAALPLSAIAGGGNLITVTTDTDSLDAFDQLCSLREALKNANTNTRFSPAANECSAGSGTDTDVIALSVNTTYTLTLVGMGDDAGDLDVANDPDLPADIVDVHFLGTSADGVPIIVQSVAGERVLEIVQADVVISETILREGSSAGVGGGIYNQGGTLLLDRAGVHDNTAVNGGGIYSTGPVILDNSALAGNEAAGLGGALMLDDAQLTMTDGFIGLNSAQLGGGIYNAGELLTMSGGAWLAGNTSTSDGAGIMNTGGGILHIDEALFQENIAGGDGGAIRSLTTAITQIDGSTFLGNSAVNGGALHHIGTPNDVRISGSRFEGNSASADGGAIVGVHVFTTGTQFHANTAGQDGGAVHASLTFDATDTILSENQAQSGGGAYAQLVHLDRVRIQDNIAGADGGGLYAWNVLRAIDTRITGNTAAGDGAGVWLEQVEQDDSNTLIRSLVAGNVAQGDGGGLWVAGAGTLVLGNSTISENRTPNGSGSGLYIDSGKLVQAINVTFADNTPGENVAKYGTLELKNSIITTPGGIDCVVALEDPQIVSFGNNLSDDGTCIGLDEPTDKGEVDVLLAPLAYTSGDTLTHALLPGSPALDAGDATACDAAPIDGVDQRGGARDIGASCDIGAHEQGAAVSLTMFGDGFE